MRFSRLYIILFLIAGNFLWGEAKETIPLAKRGILDLRSNAFEQSVILGGEWEFFWNKLFLPNSTNQGDIVPFPVKWNDLKINNQPLPSFGYATYRLKLLLPNGDRPMRIAMPDVYCAYRLYLNGKLVIETGKVATSAEHFIPKWEYKAFSFQPQTDTTEVVLQIANYVHSKGGIKDNIIIGYADKLILERNRTEAVDLLLTGCLFMGGLFFLGLYLLGNRDKAILLFSLYSIVYCYRIIGIDNYVLHTLLPDSDWHVLVHLEYTSLFVSIGLFALYTFYLYPQDVNRRIINTICIICLLFGIITFLVPPYYFTQLIDPFLVVTVLCIGYALYIYTLVFVRKRPGAIYALMSSVVLMLTFCLTLLYYWRIVPPLQLLSLFAYVSFFFLQSLILSHRVSFQLKKSKLEAEQGFLAKSDFLSNMSHEIRTPLNSVIGLSHLLLKNNPRTDQAEHLDIMLFSANNLLGIVNDILDYNKIEAGKIELDYVETDITAIARNIVAGLQTDAQEKGIALRLIIDPSLKNKVLADPTRVFQVLNNLVHNAIKFTNKGYVEVVLKVVNQNDDHMDLRTEVIDTGIGITKEKQKVIFDRFTQADNSTSRSFGGTGLGLAISKRILDLQGAILHVTSEENRGSTFNFVQHFRKTTSALDPIATPQRTKEIERPLSGIFILLVEDNSINVMVARSFLQNWGATVDVAVNGEEALEKLDKIHHRLILMDLNMPVMDGYEASRKIRAMQIDVPIIALTANLRKDIEDRVNEIGINDVIVKPFLPDELYQKVNRYLFDREH